MENILSKKTDEEIILNDRELASVLRLKKDSGELEIVYSARHCYPKGLNLITRTKDELTILECKSTTTYILARGIGLVLKNTNKTFILATIVLRDDCLFNSIKSIEAETIEFLRECYSEIMEKKIIFTFNYKGPTTKSVSITELIENKFKSIVHQGVFTESKILDLNKAKNIFTSKEDCIAEWNEYVKIKLPTLKKDVIALLKELGELNYSIESYEKLASFDKQKNRIYAIGRKRIEQILKNLDILDCDLNYP